MVQAKFIKWHPGVRIKEYPNMVLNEVVKFENKEKLDDIIDVLVLLGYYVAQHFDAKEDLLTVAIDTCWFRTR